MKSFAPQRSIYRCSCSFYIFLSPVHIEQGTGSYKELWNMIFKKFTLSFISVFFLFLLFCWSSCSTIHIWSILSYLPPNCFPINKPPLVLGLSQKTEQNGCASHSCGFCFQEHRDTELQIPLKWRNESLIFCSQHWRDSLKDHMVD